MCRPKAGIPALLVVLCVLMAVPALGQRSDAMFWGSFAIDKDLDKNTQFNFKTQGRLNNNYSSFDYAFFDFGVSRKFAKWVKADIAYVYNTKRVFFGDSHVMLPRHQVYATVVLRQKFGKFKIMNRNRFQTELEDGQFGEDSQNTDYFYRNKTTLRYKVNKTWLPYTSYEMYYRLSGFRANEPTIYRHRVSVGTYYYISKRRRIDIYYLVQLQQRRSQPDYRHVIGLSYERSLKSWKSVRKKNEKNAKLIRKLLDADDVEEGDDPFRKW